MKFAGETDVDVIKLFLHDQCDHYPFSAMAVAETLNEMARQHTKAGESLVIKSPEDNGLGRFTVVWAGNFRTASKHFTKRCTSGDELKAMVGNRVMKILEVIAATAQAEIMEPV